MQRKSLDMNDLHVETFEPQAPADGSIAAGLLGPTQWPMDCPETLPRFC